MREARVQDIVAVLVGNHPTLNGERCRVIEALIIRDVFTERLPADDAQLRRAPGRIKAVLVDVAQESITRHIFRVHACEAAQFTVPL